MARLYTKCSKCGDILWFGDTDSKPQAVVCQCSATKLYEEGPEGFFIDLTQAEIDALP